jgi:hypothetical protein
MNKVKRSKRNISSSKKTKHFRKHRARTTRKKKITGGMNTQIILFFTYLFFIHCLLVGELDNLNSKRSSSRDNQPLTQDATMKTIQEATHDAVNKWFSSKTVNLNYLQRDSPVNIKPLTDEDTLDSHLEDISRYHPEYKIPRKQVKSEITKTLNEFRSAHGNIQVLLKKNSEIINNQIVEATKKLEIFVDSIYLFLYKEEENPQSIDINSILEKARKEDKETQQKRELVINCLNYAHAVLPLIPLLNIPLPSSVRSVLFTFNKMFPPTISREKLIDDSKTAISKTTLDPNVKMVSMTLLDIVESKIEADSLVFMMESAKYYLKYILDSFIDIGVPIIANTALAGGKLITTAIWSRNRHRLQIDTI